MKKRIIVSLLITALLVSLTGCSGSSSEASPDIATADQTTHIAHDLVRSVRTYQRNFESGEWELQNTVTVEYEKDYPILFKTVKADDEARPAEITCEYKYDDDLPVRRVETDGSSKTTAEYRNGRIYNITESSVGEGNSSMRMYQYGSGGDYFTMVLQETHEPKSEDNPAGTIEEVNSIAVTTENELLKTTVNTGMYANWSEGEKKEWLRFRGVYTAEYDCDGIISLMTGDFGKDGVQIENAFIVNRDDGRITDVIEQIPDEGDTWLPLTKYEFDYTDTQISPARYSLMMNYFIVGNKINYYHYNWY